MTHVIRARNVNEALDKALAEVQEALDPREKSQVIAERLWRRKSPRGMPTIERKGIVITEYSKPMERVLFSPARDANPFFHFFEALWILDGRDDVAFLATFNPNMANYSDDGKVFHAPYGYRLRYHFTKQGCSVDQLKEVIELLKKENDTRRAVMCIWDPAEDLNIQSKDLPCNDLITLAINEGKLEMEVMCRSNDVIWGAYGANAVQFSILQEFIARAVGVEVGTLSQISRSYHFYLENETFQKLIVGKNGGMMIEPYALRGITPYPLMADDMDYREWLEQLHAFMNGGCTVPAGECDAFFSEVAAPMHKAWFAWKVGYPHRTVESKNERIVLAQQELIRCRALDWRQACHEWLERRRIS